MENFETDSNWLRPTNGDGLSLCRKLSSLATVSQFARSLTPLTAFFPLFLNEDEDEDIVVVFFCFYRLERPFT